MAMVMRAGTTASGLRVVSDFFSELANDAISIANQIHNSAVSISHNSVSQWRLNSFESALEQARALNSDSASLNHLVKLKDRSCDEQRRHLKKEFRADWSSLIQCLEDLDQQIKASAVIAVNFRLEALTTGQQRDLLNHMATEIDSLSVQIKTHVQNSLKILRDIR
jgi:uncharacterized protein YbjQ (UPF0145 family)